MLNRRDIEATLRSLLMQFQSNTDLDLERVAHFAHTGAEALLMQTRMDTWLDTAASANVLGMTEADVYAQVRIGTLPAARGAGGEPRFRRRDVSLYWLGQHLSPGTARGALRAWRDESDAWDVDPWVESTPG